MYDTAISDADCENVVDAVTGVDHTRTDDKSLALCFHGEASCQVLQSAGVRAAVGLHRSLDPRSSRPRTDAILNAFADLKQSTFASETTDDLYPNGQPRSCESYGH